MKADRESNGTWYEQVFESQDQPESNEALAPYTEVEKQPKWVARVMGRVMGQVLPLSRVKDLKVVTPRKVGAFLGQKCANLYMIGQASEKGLSEGGRVEKAMAFVKGLEAHKNVPVVASALHAVNIAGMFIGELPETADAFEKSVHEAFKKTLEQPNYNEAVEFFQGFAKGLAKPGFREGRLEQDTVATPIYLKMWLHWQEVDQMHSVTELYDFLLRSGLNKAVLGDLDRLRKLCQRIGYAPGRRGRPRK